MSQIQIKDLTFSYDSSYDEIFTNISFTIDSEWKSGLVGRNGRGKTTLLQLMMERYEYSGHITASVSFDYFPFTVSDMERLTIDIVEEVDSEYELWKICRELSLLEVDMDVLYRPFSTLSNGEQTKVLLGVLFSKEHNFLLIDEPTNHLDVHARRVVKEYLSGKRGFLLISHDRSFLDGCVDHIISIQKEKIEITKGNFSSWWENKERQDAFEQAEDEKLGKEIGKLSKAAKQKAGWSKDVEKTKYNKKVAGLRPDRGYIGHQSAKMMKRAITIENRANDRVEEKKKLLKNIETIDTLQIRPLTYRTERLVTLEGVDITYGSKTVVKGFDLKINRGERILLQGKNGSGKSSILKLILGENICHTGKVEVGSGLVISYVSQDTSMLQGSLTEFANKYEIEESLFKALLRKLDMPRVQFEKSIEEFSGGQKKKVLLARSLCQSAHLYIWDEPLNFIDVFSRIQIETLIKTYKPTMLLVEHDETFGKEIGARIIR